MQLKASDRLSYKITVLNHCQTKPVALRDSAKMVLACNIIKDPAGNCMFKVNNRNTRTRCKICSKLTIKTPERRHWRRSAVFIVNVEHISHLVVVFLLLTLSR